MATRNPAPMVSPRDPVLAALKPFLDWVHRRLDVELPPVLTVTASWNPSSVAAGASTSRAVRVPGALPGDPVLASHTRPAPVGVLLTGTVTALDTVTAVLTNLTGAAVDLPSGMLRVVVLRYA